jgi:hypothetical protein
MRKCRKDKTRDKKDKQWKKFLGKMITEELNKEVIAKVREIK